MNFKLTNADLLKMTLERREAYLKKQKKQNKYKTNKKLREEKMKKYNMTENMTEQDLKDLKEVKSHISKMKEQGRCVQCQHPWYDGLCDDDCPHPFDKDDCDRLNGIAKKAHKLTDLGIEIK